MGTYEARAQRILLQPVDTTQSWNDMTNVLRGMFKEYLALMDEAGYAQAEALAAEFEKAQRYWHSLMDETVRHHNEDEIHLPTDEEIDHTAQIIADISSPESARTYAETQTVWRNLIRQEYGEAGYNKWQPMKVGSYVRAADTIRALHGGEWIIRAAIEGQAPPPSWPIVRTLDLTGINIDDTLLERLADRGLLAEIRVLYLPQARLTDAAARTIVKINRAGVLARVHFRGKQWIGEDIQNLVDPNG